MTSALGPNGYVTDPDQRRDQTLIATSAQLATLPYQGAYVQVFAQDTANGAMTQALWTGSAYTTSVDGTGFPSSFVESRGDSYQAGTGLNPLTDVYGVRVAAALGLINRNLGVGGTGVLSQYINMTANNTATSGDLSRPVQTGKRQLVWMPGLNEARQGNTEARLQAFRGVFAAALLLAMSNWSGLRQNYNGRSATFFGAPAGSFAQVNAGNLSNYGVNGEYRGVYSTTNGGTITAIVTGDVVYIVFNRQKTNNGGTFSVSIDGAVVLPNVSCNGTGLALVGAAGETTTADSNGYPDLLRIPTSKGRHTVVVTVTSATGAGNVVGIECIGGNDDCLGGHTGVILGLPRLNAAGYAAAPAAYGSVAIGDAAVAAYQQIVQAVVAELAHDGFDLRYADTSSYDPSITGLVQADNLHATYDGQTYFVNAALKAQKTLLTKPADAKPGDVVAITMPASTAAYRNTQRIACDLALTGGTVTQIDFSRDNGANWITVATGTPYVLRLNPNDQFRATYTVAPTAQLIPR